VFSILFLLSRILHGKRMETLIFLQKISLSSGEWGKDSRTALRSKMELGLFGIGIGLG